MAFAEDMSAFFSSDEFAVEARFFPSTGAAVTANVIFDVPTQDILSDNMLTDEYAMTYPASVFTNVRSGDYGFINNVQYRIREIRLLDDGALKVAKLSKV